MSNTNLHGNWWTTEIGNKILTKKYLHESEDFNAFVGRVSGIFTDEVRPWIAQALMNGSFLLAGRSLFGAGSKGKFRATMSNCYIMPSPLDNLEDISRVNGEMMRVFSTGGGAGVNISNLRPNGAKVNNAAKTSTGACSFIHIFNESAKRIGANNRRAAMMIGMNCDHPDIEEFLTVKQNTDQVNSANLSILFTDDFMKAVRDDKPFTLSFHVESTGEKIEKTINAKEFFMKFAEAQHEYGEPGAIFIDAIRSMNYLSGYGDEYQIEITNP